MKYTVIVKTGDQRSAGLSSTAKLKIIGSDCETKKSYTLDHLFHKDFKPGAIDRYTFEDYDVGEIECISVLVKPFVMDTTERWYVEYFIVYKEESHEPVMFPYFQWITKQDYGHPIFIATNKTCILQNESIPRIMDQRRLQQTKKSVLNWRRTEGRYPNMLDVYGGYDNLPGYFRLSDERAEDFKHNLRKVSNNSIWLGVLTKFSSFTSFDDFYKFSKDLKNHPWWLKDDRWKTDEEFGRQTLNGINPGQVKRCNSLPENFPVTTEHVEGLLTRNKTLEEEIELGNIYIINYDILSDIPTGHFNDKEIQLAVPLCLFYVRKDGAFVPIAIQLGQVPGDDFPIWTPKDAPLDWLLAKIWFRNADFQVQQITSHIAYTHYILEPFVISMHRNLPPAHPIHKLLREHLQNLLAVNALVRERLTTLVR